jgi:hypothetical protein
MVRRLLDGGEELIDVVVAGLLLVAAALVCVYAAITSVQQIVAGNPLVIHRYTLGRLQGAEEN